VGWTRTTDRTGRLVAEPFGAGVQKASGEPDQILMDDRILWDGWRFSMCDDACTLHRGLVNRTVLNGAPARVTRGGLALPTVALPTAAEEGHAAAGALVPFVIATRYPHGAAVLLTALGRTLPDPIGWSEPAAHVNLTIPPATPAASDAAAGAMPVVGLLGHFASVTLHFEARCFGGRAPTDAALAVTAGLGRIVAWCCRSFTLYRVH
jgi:hypothetical protein